MNITATERLLIRHLNIDDLPTLVELINDWEIARWMTVVPHPYTLENAKEFYNEMHTHDQNNQSQFYAIIERSHNAFLGGIGLHPPRTNTAQPGEVVIGYWIGKPFWGQRYMSEAIKAVVANAFQTNNINIITAITDPNNLASHAILKKTGFHNLGLFTREYLTLRGSDNVYRWELSRDLFEFNKDPT